jgi:hypothetical protein
MNDSQWYNSAVIETLKVLLPNLLSWPVAVLVLGLLFRRNISDLLTRLSRLVIKHGDTSMEASTTGSASEQAETPRHELPSAAIILSSPETDTQPGIDTVARQAAIDFGKGIPAVQAREERIRAHLTKLDFAYNDPVTTEILIRNLAYCQAVAQAERLYRLIFGSQLALLKFLNSYGAKSDLEIRPFYEKAKRRLSKFYADYPYESWRGFLLDQVVMVHDPESNVYGINGQGRAFLTWIVGQGLTEEKPG